MADQIFPHFKKRMADGAIDLDGNEFMYFLLKDTYAYSATQRTYAHISPKEIAQKNAYYTGGTVLACTWTRTNATVKFDAGDVSWTAMTGTARYGAIYDKTAASMPLVCLQDFGSNKSVSAGTFTVIFNGSGIFTLV